MGNNYEILDNEILKKRTYMTTNIPKNFGS